MESLSDIAFALAMGSAVGMAYFGLLWLSVGYVCRRERPSIWLAGSAPMRVGLAVAALFIIMDGKAGRAVACLVGFLIVRIIFSRLVGRPGLPPSRPDRNGMPAP